MRDTGDSPLIYKVSFHTFRELLMTLWTPVNGFIELSFPVRKCWKLLDTLMVQMI